MNDKLKAEIEAIVAAMAPPANAMGMLTADDVTRIIRHAATKGSMAGWLAGERTARSHYGREMDKLRDKNT